MSIFLIQDILRIIFDYLPISDKRNLIRTCNSCYKLSILIPNVEKEFQEMINSTKYLYGTKFTSFDNPLYKYTIELVYDGYTHLIPDRYVIPENRIMHYYHNIYYQTANKGNLDMLQLMLQIKNPPNLKKNIDYLVRGAAKGGHKYILEWIMQKYKKKINHRATEYAAKGNHFELLKWLHGKEIQLTCRANAYAIKTGNMEMIKWFFERNDKISIDCLAYAIKNNNIDLLKWFYEKDNELLSEICENAIQEGKLEILKWGVSHCKYRYYTNWYSCPVHGGHIEILEWLKENNYIGEKTEVLSINAACANNFRTLKWAYENGFPISPQVCHYASLVGNLEMLKWYRKKIGVIANKTSISAVEGGHLEILKWALKKGIKMNNKLCAMAARYGHFDILKWLRDNGCPWDSTTCENAVYMGHFSILKWAYENGCPLSTKCCASTARYGHTEILKWLREKGCDWDGHLGGEAAIYNSVYIIEWFIENGYGIGPDVYGKNNLKLETNNTCWWDCISFDYFFMEDELVKSVE